MKYCYIAIGNTDNKLTQQSWAEFVMEVRSTLEKHSVQVHVEGHSLGDKPWQNCCWGFDIESENIPKVQGRLKVLARIFQQDTIAWSDTSTTFLEYK